MKSEVEETLVDKQIPYPKLMVATHDGEIVLFLHNRVGVVVGNPNPWHMIGYYSDEWFMHCFKDFHGTVTLSN